MFFFLKKKVFILLYISILDAALDIWMLLCAKLKIKKFKSCYEMCLVAMPNLFLKTYNIQWTKSKQQNTNFNFFFSTLKVEFQSLVEFIVQKLSKVQFRLWNAEKSSNPRNVNVHIWYTVLYVQQRSKLQFSWFCLIVVSQNEMLFELSSEFFSNVITSFLLFQRCKYSHG